MSKLYVHKKYLKIYFSKLNYMEICGCPSIFSFPVTTSMVMIWNMIVDTARCCIMLFIDKHYDNIKCNIKIYLMQFSFISNMLYFSLLR